MAFTCGVRSDQHLDLGVVLERFLGLEPVFAPNATVYSDHGFGPAEQGGDTPY